MTTGHVTGRLRAFTAFAVLTAAALVALTLPPHAVAALDASNSGAVSQLTVAADGTLAPKAPAGVNAGRWPDGIAVSPDGASVYVANRLSDDVSQYDAASDGTLTPKAPEAVGAGNAPVEVAISPDGASAYTANAESDDVSQYDVSPDGTLIPKASPSVGAGNSPSAITVAPDGASAYVANYSSDDVSQYDVAPDGRLTSKAPATVGAGDYPTGIALSPDGASAYVTNIGVGSDGYVSQYDVGPDGTLTPKAPATEAAGGLIPQNIAVSPDGKSAYVTNEGTLEQVGKGVYAWVGSGVAQYDIAPDGTLTPKAAPSLAAEGGPFGIAVRPDGKSAYVTRVGSGVAQYDIAADGTLTPKAPATVAAGPDPRGIAVSPDGRSAYVANAISGPTLDVDAKRKQRVSRLKVTVSCLEEPCEAVIGGKAVAKKGKRKKRDAAAAKRKREFKLKQKSLSLEAGEHVTERVKYKKGRKSVKTLRRFLKRRADRRPSKAKAVVNVTARDAAGNSAHESVEVKLKR